jgi:hypothetical protein
VDYAKQALPGWMVVEISGNTMTGRNAERLAHQAIDEARRRGQSILFIAVHMAQRSFSVGAIDEVYLAYDAGEAGATAQKMSRALTAYVKKKDKIGRIISLAFDPNRDNKFDAVILTAAANYKKHYGGNLRDALRVTLKHIDMFSGQETGRADIKIDTYLEQLMKFGRLGRIVGQMADFTNCSDAWLRRLADGSKKCSDVTPTTAVEKGKTGIMRPRSANQAPLTITAREKLVAVCREQAVVIFENIDIMIYGTKSDTVEGAIAMVESDVEQQQYATEEFGLPWDVVHESLTNGVINRNLLDLKWKAA